MKFSVVTGKDCDVRGKIIAAPLALALVITLAIAIFTIQRSGVHAYSVDKRLKLFSFQYFPGKSMDFAYPTLPPPPSKLRMQCTLLALKLGLYRPRVVQRPSAIVTIQGAGPALVVLGQIAGGESHWLELVTEKGEIINASAPQRALIPDTNVFLWSYDFYDGGKRTRVAHPLTNGIYRLRYSDEAEALAIIRVQQ